MSSLVSNWLCAEISANFLNVSATKNVRIYLSSSNEEFFIDKSVLCAVSPLVNDVVSNTDSDIDLIMPEIPRPVIELLLNLIHLGENKQEIDEEMFALLSGLLKSMDIRMSLSKLLQEENPEAQEVSEDEIFEVPNTDDIKMARLKKGELTYHCTAEGCNSHFFTHVALRKHVENVHKVYAFACYICDKRYRHQSSLKDHLLTHKNYKSHLCDICGKAFHTKDLCSSHRKLHGDRKLNCLECGAKFKQRNVLYQHKSVCHGQRRFFCQDCGKDFATKQNCTNHMRIHTGESPYNCAVCVMSFKRVHHFKKHLTTMAHIDKAMTMKSLNQSIPQLLDPTEIIGQGADEVVAMLAKQSSCEICIRNNVKFKSSYHFYKHIRSRGHFEKMLQLSQMGQFIPAHLVPPNFLDQGDTLVVSQQEQEDQQ